MQTEQAWSIGRVLAWTAAHFAGRGISTPRLDAEILLAHALQVDRVRLYTHHDQPLSQPERDAYRQLIKRRAAREPVAYIVGQREFFSRRFDVSPQVLIPRPETELLVETALSWAARAGQRPLRLLDIGTGSGVLAVTLLAELTEACGLATDISDAALAIARGNAERLGVAGRIEFAQGDCYEALGLRGASGDAHARREPFDIIVSNPPYIALRERAALQPEVALFEPHAALFADEDGLSVIRRLITGARAWMRRPALLACEIGDSQETAVRRLLADCGPWDEQGVLRDLAGRPRVAFAELC